MRLWSPWLLSALLLGCGASVAGNTSDAAVSTTPPRTLDYAFTSLTIDESTSATAPHTGFNVDERYSAQPLQQADCAHADFYSALDPDQNENGCIGGMNGCRGGVDNQLPEIASSAMMLIDFRHELALSVSTGVRALLLRVEGVNDLTNDPDVTVTVFNGHPMFASCNSIGTPGQPYAIDQSSFSTAGAPRYRFAASIVRGRLGLRSAVSAADNSFALPLPVIMGNSLIWVLNAFKLRASLSEDRGTDGNLGGYVAAVDVFESAVRNCGPQMCLSVLEGLFNGLIDVQTMNACALPNGGIGMGMGFALTRAVIQADPVSGPTRGMCGSMP